MNDTSREAGRTTISVAGIDIEVREFGRGDPLLYLHGAHGLVYDGPFLQKLAADRRVIAPSHPGFGRSPLPDWIDSVEDIAHIHLEVMDRLGLGAVDVIGASLGGWIATSMATKAPERTRRLALVAPMGVKTGPEDRLDIPDIFTMTPQALEARTFKDPAKARLDFASMTDEEVGIVARNRETHALLVWEPYMHDPKLKHRLTRLRMPVLFLRGADDGIVSDPYLRSYAALIEGARLQTIADAGHLPQLEQPDALLARINEFLAR